MIKIKMPSEKVKEVFNKCISQVADKDLKILLKSCEKELDADEKLYIKAGEENKLCEFPPKDKVNGVVSIEEMKKIYTYRMVGLKQPGRFYYNKLLNSVQICPFCGVRDVATLDHFLPKSKYATTVVTPANLIPSCRDCNSNKDIYTASDLYDEVWHPYFDDFQGVRWLYCFLQSSEPLEITFYIDTSKPDIKDEDKNKINNSFHVFKLKTLYEIHALKELNDIEIYMKKLRNEVDSLDVKEHLAWIYESNKIVNKNSWKTALYDELKDNEWYINDYLLN